VTRWCSKNYHEHEWFSADHFVDNNLVESVCFSLDITIIAFTVTAQLQNYSIASFAEITKKHNDILQWFDKTIYLFIYY